MALPLGMAGLAEAAELIAIALAYGGLLIAAVAVVTGWFAHSRIAVGIAFVLLVVIAILFSPWNAFQTVSSTDPDVLEWVADWQTFFVLWVVGSIACVVAAVRVFCFPAGIVQPPPPVTPEPQFRPGFRVSLTDGLVIAISLLGAILLGSIVWQIGFVIAFVVAHFFLFCNTFRIARNLELMWGVVFTSLTYATITFGRPSWVITAAISLVVTAGVIAWAMSRPSYHGLFWRQINPKLLAWWSANRPERQS
ncbi:hypothetical protein ETAA8_67250 [Anatilimnocola aggregata]|uniref:Uncharacterized protein n=1 Tax=Anatilimnocola aggregata TaxID=2528021 RepID=A0A517YMV7_9BACT|nr:hypothetical protein [Anatilimnocola aggregata]QDU31566.1 hypothetical protein ETAA8_67250 [Anatilimnocola aggregata]